MLTCTAHWKRLGGLQSWCCCGLCQEQNLQLTVCLLSWLLKMGDEVNWVLLLLTVKVQTPTELLHCMVQCCTYMFCSKPA